MKCHSERSEESRSDLFVLASSRTRARFFAEFTLSIQSEILRCAQDDCEGLRMTAHFQSSRVKNRVRISWRLHDSVVKKTLMVVIRICHIDKRVLIQAYCLFEGWRVILANPAGRE